MEGVKSSFVSDKIAFVDLSTLGKGSKGRGVVAQAPISAGEILVREEAVCSAPFSTAEPDADILKNFARKLLDNHPWITQLAASKEALAFADDLMSRHPEKIEDADAIMSMSDVIARIRTNMFIGAAPDDSSSQVCALLRYSSSFNHSCDPSAAPQRFEQEISSSPSSSNQKSKSPKSSRIFSAVYALKDVSKDEEISIAYVPGLLMLPSARRQERLEKIWGFKCDCHFCSKPDARPNENLLSEAIGKWDSTRVSTMSTLYAKCEQAAKSYQSPSEGVEAIKLFIEFLQLGLGQYHWRKIQVRNWYIEAAISVADFIPRAAKDLPKILSHQIASEELFLPRLHLDRLPLLRLAEDHPAVLQEHPQWQKDMKHLIDIEAACKNMQ